MARILAGASAAGVLLACTPTEVFGNRFNPGAVDAFMPNVGHSRNSEAAPPAADGYSNSMGPMHGMRNPSELMDPFNVRRSQDARGRGWVPEMDDRSRGYYPGQGFEDESRIHHIHPTHGYDEGMWQRQAERPYHSPPVVGYEFYEEYFQPPFESGLPPQGRRVDRLHYGQHFDGPPRHRGEHSPPQQEQQEQQQQQPQEQDYAQAAAAARQEDARNTQGMYGYRSTRPSQRWETRLDAHPGDYDGAEDQEEIHDVEMRLMPHSAFSSFFDPMDVIETTAEEIPSSEGAEASNAKDAAWEFGGYREDPRPRRRQPFGGWGWGGFPSWRRSFGWPLGAKPKGRGDLEAEAEVPTDSEQEQQLHRDPFQMFDADAELHDAKLEADAASSKSKEEQKEDGREQENLEKSAKVGDPRMEKFEAMADAMKKQDLLGLRDDLASREAHPAGFGRTARGQGRQSKVAPLSAHSENVESQAQEDEAWEAWEAWQQATRKHRVTPSEWAAFAKLFSSDDLATLTRSEREKNDAMAAAMSKKEPLDLRYGPGSHGSQPRDFGPGQRSQPGRRGTMGPLLAHPAALEPETWDEAENYKSWLQELREWREGEDEKSRQVKLAAMTKAIENTEPIDLRYGPASHGAQAEGSGHAALPGQKRTSKVGPLSAHAGAMDPQADVQDWKTWQALSPDAFAASRRGVGALLRNAFQHDEPVKESKLPERDPDDWEGWAASQRRMDKSGAIAAAMGKEDPWGLRYGSAPHRAHPVGFGHRSIGLGRRSKVGPLSAHVPGRSGEYDLDEDLIWQEMDEAESQEDHDLAAEEDDLESWTDAERRRQSMREASQEEGAVFAAASGGKASEAAPATHAAVGPSDDLTDDKRNSISRSKDIFGRHSQGRTGRLAPLYAHSGSFADTISDVVAKAIVGEDPFAGHQEQTQQTRAGHAGRGSFISDALSDVAARTIVGEDMFGGLADRAKKLDRSGHTGRLAPLHAHPEGVAVAGATNVAEDKDAKRGSGDIAQAPPPLEVVEPDEAEGEHRVRPAKTHSDKALSNPKLDSLHMSSEIGHSNEAPVVAHP